MNHIVRSVLLSFIFILALVVVFWGVQWFSNSVDGILIHRNNVLQSSLETSFDNAKASVVQNPIISQNLLPLRDWETEDLKLEAESAISVEFGDGKEKTLFKKNEGKKLPIASLTKLMTTLVVLDNYNLSQKITIDELAIGIEGEQGDLKLGQVFTVKDLLYIMLMESSNRAAFALSEVLGPDVFISLMNKNAKQMHLENTHFQDASGLDPRSYSTAQDLVTLSEYLFEHYPLFREIIGLEKYDLYLPDGSLHHTLINTNKILGEEGIIGGKTGFTEKALGCFMVIKNSPVEGNHFINIILGADDKFDQMLKIIDWVNQAYQFKS